jgi:hypothetical protein
MARDGVTPSAANVKTAAAIAGTILNTTYLRAF